MFKRATFNGQPGSSRLHAILEAVKEKFVAYAAKSSARERALAVIAGLSIVTVLGYQSVTWVSTQFQEQDQRLTESKKNLERAAVLLDSYVKLSARKQQIEKEYQQIELKEGGLAYLEKLVREEAGVTEGFKIVDSPPKPFGGGYEQTSFAITFGEPNLDKLVSFLTALVKGRQPFILSKLDVQKSRRGDRLDVDIEASGIRKIAQ